VNPHLRNVINKEKLTNKVLQTITNCYSALEVLNDRDSIVSETPRSNKSNDAKSLKGNQTANQEECEEGKGVSKITSPVSVEQGPQHVQGSAQKRQGREEGEFSKIPTIINNVTVTKRNHTSSSMRNYKGNTSKRRTFQNRNTKIKSAVQCTAVQHKVLLMGDSHFRGGTVKIRNMLSAKFEVTAMIKPGARSTKNIEQFHKECT
jgi:hypothetical protein